LSSPIGDEACSVPKPAKQNGAQVATMVLRDPNHVSTGMDQQQQAAKGSDRDHEHHRVIQRVCKILSFGGEGVIAENDPDEHQKRLRYNDLVASAVILHNVVDMSRILSQLKAAGQNIYQDDLNFLSPHLTSSIKRFGDYTLNMARPPEPWLDNQPPPRKSTDRFPSQAVLPFAREA
jgi:hypothetical protein